MSAIVSAVAWVIGWFAARGIDQILGKWVAYFKIAWDNAATANAQSSYRSHIELIQKDIIATNGSVQEWRKKQGLDDTKGIV